MNPLDATGRGSGPPCLLNFEYRAELARDAVALAVDRANARHPLDPIGEQAVVAAAIEQAADEWALPGQNGPHLPDRQRLRDDLVTWAHSHGM